MNVITLEDEKIVTYFNNNPLLCPEKVMNMIIDMLENVNNNYTETLSSKMISNIANQVKLLDNKLDKVYNNTEQISNIISLVQSQRDNIISDVRMILKNNNTDYSKEINSLIKDNNGLFISNMQDKLLTITNPDLREKIEIDINKSIKNIKKDINELIKLNEKDSSVYEKLFSSNYDFMCKEIKNHIQDNIVPRFDGIQKYVDKQNSSCVTNIGKNSENKMEPLLNECFPDAEIENTTGKTGEGDFIIHRNATTKRIATKVMIENKCYTNNVPIVEVEKFIRDIENIKCHGVFISQNSGISSKSHFDINFHEKYILIYLHSVNYNKDIIYNAVQMIDIISSRVDLKSNNMNVSKEVMENIKKELLDFLTKQKLLLDNVKKMNKDITKQIEELEFPCLSNLLNISDASSKDTLCPCPKCGELFKNKYSLGSHKKGCKGTKNLKDNNIINYTK